MKERQRERLAVRLKDFILGFQDGVVSNLGLVLGVAIATLSTRIVIISGVAAALGEFISMTAVAYTSTEASESYYKSEKHRRFNIPKEYRDPIESGLLVGFSNIIGSAIALLPFFFLEINTAIKFALVFCAIALFLTGVVRARLTFGNWFRSGMELLIIGMVAAIAGYFIGRILGVAV